MYDGCFFDNFMMSQRWLNHDIYDRPGATRRRRRRQARREGCVRQAPGARGYSTSCATWRKLMPWALTSGHSQGYPYPEIAEIFNGQGIGFYTTDAIEGKQAVLRTLELLSRLVHRGDQAGDHFGRVGRARSDRLRLRLQPPASYPAGDLGLRTRLLSLHAVRACLHLDERRLLQPRAGRHGPWPGLVVRRIGFQAGRASGGCPADRAASGRGPRTARQRRIREDWKDRWRLWYDRTNG